jgi:autonomous glycyl radical cofactor GrcA
VREKILKSGLPLPQKPKDIVVGTDLLAEWDTLVKKSGGISNVSYHELGTYLDRWTELLAYARYLEAGADISKTISSEVREQVRNMLYTRAEGGRELRAASVHEDSLYIEWAEKAIKDQSYYTMLRALVQGYEYRTNAISREITRRSSDTRDMSRTNNRGNI